MKLFNEICSVLVPVVLAVVSCMPLRAAPAADSAGCNAVVEGYRAYLTHAVVFDGQYGEYGEFRIGGKKFPRNVWRPLLEKESPTGLAYYKKARLTFLASVGLYGAGLLSYYMMYSDIAAIESEKERIDAIRYATNVSLGFECVGLGLLVAWQRLKQLSLDAYDRDVWNTYAVADSICGDGTPAMDRVMRYRQYDRNRYRYTGYFRARQVCAGVPVNIWGSGAESAACADISPRASRNFKYASRAWWCGVGLAVAGFAGLYTMEMWPVDWTLGSGLLAIVGCGGVGVAGGAVMGAGVDFQSKALKMYDHDLRLHYAIELP